MDDPIERMAAALEEQNRIRCLELEQARRDEQARLLQAEASTRAASASEELARLERARQELVEALVAEVRALIAVNQAVLERPNSIEHKVDSVLELQRIVVGRMLRDISDKAELDRITAILREVASPDVNVQAGGTSVRGGRDAGLSAGRDVVSD